MDITNLTHTISNHLSELVPQLVIIENYYKVFKETDSGKLAIFLCKYLSKEFILKPLLNKIKNVFKIKCKQDNSHIY